MVRLPMLLNSMTKTTGINKITRFYRNECLFCGEDLSNEKFREDYILVAVMDDPQDKESLNKMAKPAHLKCVKRFVDLNIKVTMKIIDE